MIKSNTMNPPEPKVILDRNEYDELIRREMQLQIIRRGMEQNLVIYHNSKLPFLKSDFLEILKVVFPYDYDRKVRDLILEEEMAEKEEGGEA